MLAKLSNDDIGKKWPNVISEIVFAVNNSIHKTTGESTSMLLFGINQNGKIQDHVKAYLDSDVNNKKRNLSEIREKAQITCADKKRKPATIYNKGDYVMVRNFDSTPGHSPKLIPKYKGPYEIIKVLRNNQYVIGDIYGFQVTNTKYSEVWNADNMRLWRRNKFFEVEQSSG